MSETNESQEPVAVGSDSNEGLGAELKDSWASCHFQIQDPDKEAVEVLRIDKDGFVYKGQRIEDAGEAHRAWLEVMALQKTYLSA